MVNVCKALECVLYWKDLWFVLRYHKILFSVTEEKQRFCLITRELNQGVLNTFLFPHFLRGIEFTSEARLKVVTQKHCHVFRTRNEANC